MKLWILFSSVLLLAPYTARAITFATENSVPNEDLEAQKPQETKLFKNCKYSLKTSLENDHYLALNGDNGNDDGYTHGHLTRITKSCDSGKDINLYLDSRLFTETLGYYESTTPEGIIVLHLFEEENRASLELTEWRDFSKMYPTIGVTIGTLSRNKLRLAGLEQQMFHDILDSSTLGGQGSDEDPNQITTGRFNIAKYNYLDEDNNNREFFGGHIALGKNYSLDGLREICASPCIDYFRTEAGMEILSLKHKSNIYIFSEIDKRMPHPLEAFSVFASIKAQKNKDIKGLYNESALGLRFRAKKFQLHYIIKKRSLPDEWSHVMEYDTDEDRLVFIGFEVPF